MRTPFALFRSCCGKRRGRFGCLCCQQGGAFECVYRCVCRVTSRRSAAATGILAKARTRAPIFAIGFPDLCGPSHPTHKVRSPVTLTLEPGKGGFSLNLCPQLFMLCSVKEVLSLLETLNLQLPTGGFVVCGSKAHFIINQSGVQCVRIFPCC